MYVIVNNDTMKFFVRFSSRTNDDGMVSRETIWASTLNHAFKYPDRQLADADRRHEHMDCYDSTTMDVSAAHLYELQAGYNNGRGISCVRTICTFLNANAQKSAQAVCNNESDKLRNYPDVVDWLTTAGFIIH